MKGMRRAFFAFLFLLLLGFLAALGVFAWGWWTYKRSEAAIVERMDQYFLSITSPAREQYLLEEDETFEVPYMASRLSVAAVPTKILDREGRLIGEYSVEKGVFVSDSDHLPVFLKRALVAAEDGTFYEHPGWNWRAIGRAALTNLRRGGFVQGGSTITQQLAKLMFTTRKKSIGRKVYELFCARALERKFTKDQILLMYFNFAYFGHGAFGVEAASRYYFAKSARELELAEAAMLVGIVASPNKYSPYENLALAQARHRTVLSRMAKLNFIPDASVTRISEEFWRRMTERVRRPEVSFWRMRVNEAPYVVEFLRRRLLEDFTKERLLKGGLVVHTTFDLELQKSSAKALKSVLAEENRSGKEAPIEGALAMIDPKDGAILALEGGSAFNYQNQLIRAVDSARPIGSAIKPFVWAQAFESGKFTPESKFDDAVVEYRVGGGKRWAPRNYGDKNFGSVTLAFALHKSLNTVAVKLLKELDVDAVIALLRAATGLPRESFQRNLALALGTPDVSPLTLARAYALFANGCRPVEPYFLLYVEDRNGHVLKDERQRPPPASAVLKPETCRTMIEVMKGVLGPQGTAYPAVLKTGFNIPAAGKTGTTNDYRDAWFAGVTPDLAGAVWLGHDDMRVSLGEGKAGAALAAPVWMEAAKAWYRNRPRRDFEAVLAE